MAPAEYRGAVDLDTGAIGVFRNAARAKPKPSAAKLHTLAVSIKFDVVIEYCARATFHTQHKPETYLGYFEDVKAEIQHRHPCANVFSNPWESNKEFNRGRRDWVVLDHLAPMEDVSRPRLGSFEVAIVGPKIGVKVLHSKLESGRFPNPRRLAESVVYALDESWQGPPGAVLPAVLAAATPHPGRGPRQRPRTLTPRVRRNLPIAQPRMERTWHLPHHPARDVRPVRDVRALSVLYKQRELQQRCRATEAGAPASRLGTPPEPFSPVNDWAACQAATPAALARTAELLERLATPSQIAAAMEEDMQHMADSFQSASEHGSAMPRGSDGDRWAAASFSDEGPTVRRGSGPQHWGEVEGTAHAGEASGGSFGDEDPFESDGLAELSAGQEGSLRARASPPESEGGAAFAADDVDRTRAGPQPPEGTLQAVMPVHGALSHAASHGATTTSRAEYSDFESEFETSNDAPGAR